MLVKLRKSVTLWGHKAAAGEVIEVDDESAKALVRDGAADYEVVENKDGNQDPGADDAAKAAEEAAKAAEAIEMQKKALDAQYKADELKAAAKETGVEFPYDAKKGEVIDAVIAAGKAEALLK